MTERVPPCLSPGLTLLPGTARNLYCNGRKVRVSCRNVEGIERRRYSQNMATTQPTSRSPGFSSNLNRLFRTFTTSYGVNTIMDNKDSPGLESIFTLQPTAWLHDAIITWWCGYWCTRTGDISNYSITKQANKQQARAHL
jgi:hypothetical protein